MARVRDKGGAVEAEMPLAFGSVQVVRRFWQESIDVLGRAPYHHLELSLLPRSQDAKGCFPERWGPHRFEPIGELFFLPAGQLVHARSACGHQNSIVCRLEPEAMAKWVKPDMEWTDCRLQGSLDITGANLRSLLFRIGEELRSPGFASEAIIELMVNQVAIELSRYLAGIGEDRSTGGLAPWRLRLIDERLAESGPCPSLIELADLCSLSVRHMTRAFRLSRGRSIGDYIAEHRMDHAKQLLASGLAVKTVAEQMGFAAPTNFAAAFRRATGENPRQYMDRLHRRHIRSPHLPHAIEQ